MYHRDFARQGRRYDHDHHDKAELERDGWVDSIEKMGKLEWTVNNPAPPDLEPNSDDYDNEEDYLHDWYKWFTRKKGNKAGS